MITSLQLKNFRGFENLTIDHLSQVTLISGKNDVGKSSLLESIFCLQAFQRPDLLLQLLHLRSISFSSLTPQQLWKHLFYKMDDTQTIEISTTEDHKTHRLLMKRVLSSDVRNTNIQISQVEAGKQLLETSEQYSLEVSYVGNASAKKSTSTIITWAIQSGQEINVSTKSRSPQVVMTYTQYLNNESGHSLAEQLGKAEVAGKTANIVEKLHIIDKRINGLYTILEGKTANVYVDIGLGQKLPINVLGNGVNKLLEILLALAVNPCGILLIDEIDNGFHFSSLEKIWDAVFAMAKEEGCQIFATTHSGECIEACCAASQKATDVEFSYIRLTQNNKQVDAKTYDRNLLKLALESEMEVR